MLYRTHHHPLLITTLPHYSSSSSPLSPHLILSSSPSLPLQKMECVQETLKTGVDSETAPFEEDDFFVDELLDFSNGFSETEDQSPELKEPEVGEPEPDRKRACSVFQESEKEPAKDEFVSLPESEISVPVEGLESLEWLSHFVEDSFSDYSLTEKLPPKPAENRSEPAVPVHESPCFATPVQTKARTKRARTGVRVWPVLSPESSTSSSSSTSSITVESFFGKPMVKKLKKRSPESAGGGGGGAAAAQPRRCSHCGVTKTPQWRAGPLGSKTLCNACGVRYKSGRLLPEYRPACSPTFSTEMHSNNHRKVLEMRRKKEVEVETTVPPPPVRSF